MPRPILRYALLVCLMAAAGFAAWSWFRPYSWKPDPSARCEIVATLVTRDQSYFWVNVHLKVNPGANHDLQKPVWLQTSRGVKLEPADTTLGGKDGQAVTEIWLKFWLEAADLEGALVLHLNDGKLTVKSGNEAPQLKDSAYRNFTTNRW